MRRVVLRRQEWQDRDPWKWWGNHPTCHSLDVSGSCHASWWFFSDLDSLVEDFARKFHLAISYCDGTPLSWGMGQYAWDLYGWRSIQFPISCDNHAVEATQLIIHQQDPIEWTLANFAGGRSGSPWGQPSSPSRWQHPFQLDILYMSWTPWCSTGSYSFGVPKLGDFILEGWDSHNAIGSLRSSCGLDSIYSQPAGDAVLVSEHHAMLPQMWTGRTAAHHPHVPCFHVFLRLVRCFPGKSTENPHVWG